MTTEPLDLDSIKARCEAATPGPWRWWDASELRSLVFEDDPHLDDLSAPIVGEPIMGGFGEPEWDISVADAEFIAHAREDVPALVAEVKRLRAALGDLWPNLADANLADANLADANLAGANLAGADLAGAYGNEHTVPPSGWRVEAGRVVSDE